MKTKTATIIATGEALKVYPLRNGNYYDYNNMSEDKPPSAPKADKKEFARGELIFP